MKREDVEKARERLRELLDDVDRWADAVVPARCQACGETTWCTCVVREREVRRGDR